MPKLGDVVHLHSRLDTGTLKELCAASLKLYQAESHGRVFSWIDSGTAFLQTALFSTVRLVKHVALAALSLIGILSQSGRRFLVENVVRSVVDLTGIVIGLVGALSPWTGHDLTAREIMFLNRFLLKNDLLSTSNLEGMTYENPLWISYYMFQNNQRMHEASVHRWGGMHKLRYKSKA